VAFEHKPNRGSLFKADKQGDTDRDYSGTALIEGRLFWVSGWVSESKAGRKYLSLSFKPQDTPAPDKSKALSEDLNDAVPS
jgi:hypothetical protein